MDAAGVVTAEVVVARVALDGSVGTWQATTALPVPLHSTRAVVFRGFVYLAGVASVWAGDRPKKIFEWQSHSMFLIPGNYHCRLSNMQADQPVRLLHCSYLPLAMSVLPDPEIFFDNPQVDFNLLYGQGAHEIYSEAKVVTLDEVISQDELNKIANLLNSLVEGMLLSRVRQLLVAKMAEEKAIYDALLRRALKVGQQSFVEPMEGEVYIDGTANMMQQPEFADVGKMRAIFVAFEEKSKLVKILDQCLAQEGLTTIIGSENVLQEWQPLSLVTAPYWCGDDLLGTLGVIGPTRMEYSKIIPLVDFTARLFSQYLTEEAS